MTCNILLQNNFILLVDVFFILCDVSAAGVHQLTCVHSLNGKVVNSYCFLLVLFGEF